MITENELIIALVVQAVTLAAFLAGVAYWMRSANQERRRKITEALREKYPYSKRTLIALMVLPLIAMVIMAAYMYFKIMHWNPR